MLTNQQISLWQSLRSFEGKSLSRSELSQAAKELKKKHHLDFSEIQITELIELSQEKNIHLGAYIENMYNRSRTERK